MLILRGRLSKRSYALLVINRLFTTNKNFKPIQAKFAKLTSSISSLFPIVIGAVAAFFTKVSKLNFDLKLSRLITKYLLP